MRAAEHGDWFDEALRWAKGSTDTADCDVKLGAENARAVAREILKNADAYSEAVRSAIEATNDNVVVRFLPEEPTIRFAPGVVIDFAAFDVLVNDQVFVRGRACVTVCLHESQSKIWIRFSQVATQLTLRGLLDRTGPWFDDAVKQIADKYQQDIETVLRSRVGAARTGVELEARHKIEIVSADLPGDGLAALAEALDDGVPVSSVEGASAASEAMDALVQVVHQEAPPPLVAVVHDSAIAGRPVADANTYLIAHRTARGNFGVYLARAKGWHVILVGVAGNDDRPLIEPVGRDTEDNLPAPSRPASLNVSAELANTVARHF